MSQSNRGTENKMAANMAAYMVTKVKTTFVCRRCLGSMKDDDLVEKSVIIGNGVELEKVRKFSYLGDMLDADGGMDYAVTTRVKCTYMEQV
jgi:hypothetical protein